MAANFINLTDTLEEWRVKANEVYGKVGDLDTLVKTATVNYTGVIGINEDTFTGTHATFTVTRFNGQYSVAITNGGSGYDVGDTILVDGSSLGGSSGTNDATITITAVDPGFAATDATVAGSAVGDLISEVNSIRDELGSLISYSLDTDAQTFYEAINELENIVRAELNGAANYTLSTDANNLIAAINEIEAALRGANADYNLNTNSNDVVSAINEFQSEIGRVEDFDAQGTSSNNLVDYVNLGSTIVSAINALKDKADLNADQIGGIVGDDYDGPDTNIISALNSLYNRSDLGTLDNVYIRRDGTLDMTGLFQLHSTGITSNGNNLLLKTGASDVTAVTINASNQNVGIGGSAGTHKVKVTGALNATTGLYWDGDSTDTRYIRADVGSAQNLDIDTTVRASIALTPNAGETVTIGGSEVTNDTYNFLEWVQDQVGSMVTSNVEERGISAVYDDSTGKLNFAIANNSHNHVVANITDFTEEVQDTVGAMISGNTENGLTVTYNDTSGKLNFDVNDPVITISGEASGSATMTNLGNTNISVTLDHEAIQDAVGEMLSGNTETGLSVTYDDSSNKIDFALTASPIISLSGDVSGSTTITNLATGTYDIAVTIADDSHNHTISNIDNFTENVQDIVGTMINPTNIEAGLVVSYDDDTGKINFDVNDPTITLSGDVTGSATMTNLGSIEITTTVANNSHTHDDRYYTETEADSRFVNASGDNITGNLTVEGDLYIGENGGGDSQAFFYDDNSNTWRTLQWDDSSNAFMIEDNGGSMRSIIHSGTIGSQSVSYATTAGSTPNATNASNAYHGQTDNNATYYLSFVGGADSGNKSMRFDDNVTINPGTNTITCANFAGTATTALYADLAEKYLPDADYEVGTVMSIGGDAEVTASSVVNQHSVLGVVSDKPAFAMNEDLEGGVYVALKGRVPVKVIGKVKKGDRLAPSTEPGLATVNNGRDAWSFAIALEDGENGVVEAVIL
jgi:phage host-nuclease inhibitor protein Gam